MAACSPIVTTSSLNRAPSASRDNDSLIAIMVRCGLARPLIPPVWGPDSESGMERENRLPLRIDAAARRTTSAVIRLRVPS